MIPRERHVPSEWNAAGLSRSTPERVKRMVSFPGFVESWLLRLGEAGA